MGPVRNITNENFEPMAAAFANLNDGVCFEIGLEDWLRDGLLRPAKIGQWMAWRDYRIKKNLSVRFMDHQARRKKQWTVPSEWPHEFDAERTIADDMMVEARFKYNPFAEKIVDENYDVAKRQEFIKRVFGVKNSIGDRSS